MYFKWNILHIKKSFGGPFRGVQSMHSYIFNIRDILKLKHTAHQTYCTSSILNIASILPTKDSLLGVKQSACGFFTPEGGRINTHFAAFFEIYKISIPLHRSDLENSVKNRHQFCEIEYWKFNRNITIFAGKLLFLAEIEVKFCRNFANVLQNIQTQWGLQKICKILKSLF